MLTFSDWIAGKKAMMKNLDVFAFFVAVRLASVLIVQTWYVPDEYWQSLEVAHNIAFGYGYLTWEWILGIRSYLHPLVIALVYKVLELLNLDYVEALIYLPRVLQALLSAYADLCFYRWSGTKKWAVFSISSAWFWFYAGSRTIINSLETALTTIALANFPWTGKGNESSNKFIGIVALLCLVRPTAAIQWLPLCIYHLIISEEKVLTLVLKKYLPIGTIGLILSTILDSFAHGSFIVTSFEFLKANVINGVGEWYGSQPWHWYLSIGFPAVLGIQFIPFVLATINIIKNRHLHQNELALLGCIVFTLTIYSLLPHKEFRFILPLLPVALNISSGYLSRWSHKAEMYILWLVAGVILVGNIVPVFYLSTIHQRGTLDVMTPLREITEKNSSNASFLFLMPCHSTPLYSHLHVNVTTRFLTCEPNLQQVEHYVDEADEFYDNPNWWMRNHYPSNGPLPSHIVTFDGLVPFISDVLSRYKPLYRIFHTYLPSGRVGRYVLIHQRVDF